MAADTAAGIAPDTSDFVPSAPSTAERLASVALDLFVRRGYDEVTTAEIAEAAGVSQRTFFRHFPTKLDVLFHGTEEASAAFVEVLYGRDPELPVGRARVDAIIEHDRAFPLRPDDVSRVLVVRTTPSLSDAIAAYEVRFEGELSRWIAQRWRRPEDDFDVRVLAAALVAARRSVVEEWSSSGGAVDIGELARRAIELVSVPGAETPGRGGASVG